MPVVEAIRRAKATRKARHTLGRKQREAIKGAPPAPANPPSGGSPARAAH